MKTNRNINYLIHSIFAESQTLLFRKALMQNCEKKDLKFHSLLTVCWHIIKVELCCKQNENKLSNSAKMTLKERLVYIY